MNKPHWYLRAPLNLGLIAAHGLLLAALVVFIDRGLTTHALVGGMVGLVSGVFEVLSRRTISDRLRSAASFAEVIWAYQASAWGRFKNLVTVVLFVIAYLLLPRSEFLTAFLALLAGFAIVDSAFRVVFAGPLSRVPLGAADVR